LKKNLFVYSDARLQRRTNKLCLRFTHMRAFICNNYEHYRKMRITRETERSLTAIALHDVQSVDSRPLRNGPRDGGDRSELPYTVP